MPQLANNTKIHFSSERKNEQRRRGQAARSCGEPTSARDKELERSRKEGSVTRRRAEVCIAQLEGTARRLSAGESELTHLQRRNNNMNHALSKAQEKLANLNRNDSNNNNS